jgi:predicted Zn-dependent protease
MRTPRSAATVVFVGLALATAATAFDLNKLNKAIELADPLKKVVKGMAGIGPEEEAAIGDSVALEIIAKYGLVRDEAVTRRVTLVGRTLSRYSDRPDLAWTFGVLDSPTINAFSAPSGYVFITRGLYDLAENDDILAAILGHEIAHITGKHALKIVSRGEFLSGLAGGVIARSSDAKKAEAQLKQFNLGIAEVTKTLFEKGYDPATEFEADKTGRALAVTTGYAPGGLRLALQRLAQRTGDPKDLFPTHPPLADRLQRLPADAAPAAGPAPAGGAAPSAAKSAAAPTPAASPAALSAEEKALADQVSQDEEDFFSGKDTSKKKPRKKSAESKP